MGFSEEVILRLGLDGRQIPGAMKTAVADVSRGAEGLKEEIGKAFSAGAVIAFFEKVLSYFDELQKKAENLEVSTDFLQGGGFVASQQGSSVEKFGKALDVLSRKLGEAKNGSEEARASFAKLNIPLERLLTLSPEEAFFALADQVKRTDDASRRTALAFDLLGKTGAGLVSTLAEGSKALRKHIESVDKLSEAEIKAVASANDQIEATKNHAIVAGGHMVAFFADIAQTLGKLSVGLGLFQRAMAEAARQKVQAEWDKFSADNEKAEEAHQAAITKIQEEAQARQDKIDAEGAKEKEKLRKEEERKNEEFQNRDLELVRRTKATLLRMEQNAVEARQRFANAREHQGDWTLADVAALDPSMLSRANRWKIGAAQDVLDTRRQADFAHLEGNFDFESQLRNRSNQLASSIVGLRPEDQNPLGAIEAEAKKQTEIADKTLTLFQTTGINVNLPD